MTSTAADPSSPSGTTTRTSSRNLVQAALDANKRLQEILTQRAEQLEADLKEVDSLLDAASTDDTQDDPESEIVIPGAKKATSLFPLTEFLNPVSPFYEEAIKRSNYLTNTNLHPMKEKDFEVLADAVRRENQRLQAYKSRPQGSYSMANATIDLDNNIEGLDWMRIAERVSDASSVKRSAIDCRVCWIGDRHPRINHGEWAAPEVTKLSGLVSAVLEEKGLVDWVEIAKQLGTDRTPLDCLRHGLPRQRHFWTPDQDQRLIDSVKSCGIGNWQLVARNVSPHTTAAQCQNRWCKSLDPTLKRGNWTEEEDDRLRKAVAGYGPSWVQVASAIPGRTNDQCRERWHEHLNLSAEKAPWTEAEDNILLENVKLIGNRWKTISLKIGNNRTGPTCRLRYDKLMRLQNAPSSATPGPSNTQSVSTMQVSEDSSLSTTTTQRCLPFEEVALPTAVPKSRPKPRATGKEKTKTKETIIEPERNTGPVLSLPEKVAEAVTIATSESQVDDNGSTAAPTRMTVPVPRPRPITRAKGKSIAVENATTLSEDVLVSGVSSSEITPRRGSKRKIQVDEAPVPKKRKTNAPKPAIPMSLPQSIDGTSPPIDGDEILETEHSSDPKRVKRTLRKRKIATAATTVEDASDVPVKRSRGRTRK